MSSVIAVLTDTEIIVATDTLATPLPDVPGGFQFFTSKATLLPHMNLILAGTGEIGFLELFCLALGTRRFYPGIESLAAAAGIELGAFWEAHVDSHPRTADREQAVYLFGLSEFTGEAVAYECLSWEGFEPREMSVRATGRGVILARPKCTLPTGIESIEDFPRVVEAMMQEQRWNQLAKPDGQVTIGGEIQIHHLSQQGCSIYKLHRFEDYAKVERDLWGDFRASYAANFPDRKVLG